MEHDEGVEPRLAPMAEAFMRTIFGLEPRDYVVTRGSRLTDFSVKNESAVDLVGRVMAIYHLRPVPNQLLQLFRELQDRLEAARKKFPAMWTIYQNPSDVPDKFVVRVWYGDEVWEPTSTAHDSLDDARESIISRGGCMPFDRDAEDDVCIVETWI